MIIKNPGSTGSETVIDKWGRLNSIANRKWSRNEPVGNSLAKGKIILENDGGFQLREET